MKCNKFILLLNKKKIHEMSVFSIRSTITEISFWQQFAQTHILA